MEQQLLKDASPQPRKTKCSTIPAPTQAELDACYAKLFSCDKKPAVLRVLDNYADQFIPLSRNPTYPKSLSYLYNPATLDMDYLQLLEECERVFADVKVKNIFHFFLF